MLPKWAHRPTAGGVVQRVVLVNVAEPIEYPGALLKGSRPPKLGSEPNLSNGLSGRLRRSLASIAHAPQRLHPGRGLHRYLVPGERRPSDHYGVASTSFALALLDRLRGRRR